MGSRDVRNHLSRYVDGCAVSCIMLTNSSMHVFVAHPNLYSTEEGQRERRLCGIPESSPSTWCPSACYRVLLVSRCGRQLTPDCLLGLDIDAIYNCAWGSIAMENRQNHRSARSRRLLHPGMDYLGAQMQAPNGTIQGLSPHHPWKRSEID